MKALSIKQPWAWLICKGLKDIENRTWPTNVRGRVYVHAGKTVDVEALLHMEDFPENYNFHLGDKVMGDLVSIIEPLRGAIIGEVDITGCKFRFPDENDNLYSHWHVRGQYGFTLANPVLYDKPIPYRGQLGFFEVEFPNPIEVKK